MAPKLFLASNSPRRRQLLSLAGWPFTVRAVEIDERPFLGERPAAYVMRLAEGKARAASGLADPDDLILAADTTVADGDLILGKPTNAAEARAMLQSLRGKAHLVYTAIFVLDSRSGRVLPDLCATRVWMRDYSDEEMEAYIASGDPFDKAGAYAIQNHGFHPVERIEGCYNCVVGLPLCRVVQALSQFGLTPPTPITSNCLPALQTDTPCQAYIRLLEQDPGFITMSNGDAPDKS